MNIKTSDLSLLALNWAVSVALGRQMVWLEHFEEFGEIDPDDSIAYDPLPDYCYNWAHGGPLVRQAQISFEPQFAFGRVDTWICRTHAFEQQGQGQYREQLVAAMRSFVASQLGDTVDVPEQALQSVA